MSNNWKCPTCGANCVKNTRASGWISVDDSHPSSEGPYLTYWSDGLYEVINYDHDNRELFEGKMIANAVMISWMPLPPPPEKDDE